MMHMKNMGTNAETHCIWTSLPFFISVIITGIVIGSVAEKPLFEFEWARFGYTVYSERFFAAADIKNTFIISVLCVCIAFIAGFSAIGQPLAYFLLLNGGTAVGSCIFTMYKLYGKSAVLPLIMTVLPKAAVIFVITVLAVRSALKSSAALFCVYRDSDIRDSRELDLRLYCIRFIVLMLLALVFSAAVGVFDFLYLKLFRL